MERELGGVKEDPISTAFCLFKLKDFEKTRQANRLIMRYRWFWEVKKGVTPQSKEEKKLNKYKFQDELVDEKELLKTYSMP